MPLTEAEVERWIGHFSEEELGVIARVATRLAATRQLNDEMDSLRLRPHVLPSEIDVVGRMPPLEQEPLRRRWMGVQTPSTEVELDEASNELIRLGGSVSLRKS